MTDQGPSLLDRWLAALPPAPEVAAGVIPVKPAPGLDAGAVRRAIETLDGSLRRSFGADVADAVMAQIRSEHDAPSRESPAALRASFEQVEDLLDAARLIGEAAERG